MSRFAKITSVCWELLLVWFLLGSCALVPGGDTSTTASSTDCPAAPAGSSETALGKWGASCCPATTTSDASSQKTPLQPSTHLDGTAPYRTIAFWLDITGSFPRQYLEAAKQALANTIDASILPGEQGATIYVAVINHDSWTPESVLLTLAVPSVPADPPLPTMQAAPKATGNQYTDSNNDSDTQTANCNTLRTYYATLVQSHTQLRSIQQIVKQQDTDPLRKLTLPGVDNTGTDEWGAIERSAQWFQAEPGEHWYIAITDLWNNESDQQTTHLFNFSGVNARLLWHYCGSDATAEQCSENDAYWKNLFLEAGAASVKMFDPATSVALGNNLFS